jgi:hypothetical protein
MIQNNKLAASSHMKYILYLKQKNLDAIKYENKFSNCHLAENTRMKNILICKICKVANHECIGKIIARDIFV